MEDEEPYYAQYCSQKFRTQETSFAELATLRESIKWHRQQSRLLKQELDLKLSLLADVHGADTEPDEQVLQGYLRGRLQQDLDNANQGQ